MRYRSLALTMTVLVLLASTPAVCSVDVAVSIFPVASIVEEIGGDRVTVTTLVPGGMDPHHFELTPRSARALHDADIVLTIGGRFDHWIPQASAQQRRAVHIELYELFADSLIPIKDSFNPHFWLDPLCARAIGKAVYTALCTVDLANCAYYEARTKMFASAIDSLHVSAKQRLAATGFDRFVSFHPAWSYFARRYGIREVETIEISHDQEPSARHVAGVVRKIRADGVKYIIAEAFSNRDLANGIASQTATEVIVLDPIGGPDRQGRDSYFGLIDYNISVIERIEGTNRTR
jgi:zinc transport system substrate-binding protein